MTEIKCARHISKRVSIGNWLDNGAVTEANKAIIKQMHLDLHEAGKRAYNMAVAAGGIFIDMKFVIVAAVK